jgi:hypothetical protein
LLEALYLVGRQGSADGVIELNRLRGVPAENSRTEFACSWLFHEKVASKSREISITCQTDFDTDDVLKIWMNRPPGTHQIEWLFKTKDRTTVTNGVELGLSRRSGSGFGSGSGAGTGFGNGSGIFGGTNPPAPYSPSEINGEPRCLLVDHRSWDRNLDLELFSQLRARGAHAPIVESLKSIDPRLNDLEMLVIEGETGFYASLNGHQDLVPIWSVGDGFRHLLSIVTAVASCRDGIVLIDEIENGLHYSVLPDVWTAVNKAAEEANVQVFATTHSRECVVAAEQVFEATSDEQFRMHRLERGRSGEVEAVTYDREALGTSLEQGWEIR